MFTDFASLHRSTASVHFGESYVCVCLYIKKKKHAVRISRFKFELKETKALLAPGLVSVGERTKACALTVFACRETSCEPVFVLTCVEPSSTALAAL